MEHIEVGPYTTRPGQKSPCLTLPAVLHFARLSRRNEAGLKALRWKIFRKCVFALCKGYSTPSRTHLHTRAAWTPPCPRPAAPAVPGPGSGQGLRWRLAGRQGAPTRARCRCPPRPAGTARTRWQEPHVAWLWSWRTAPLQLAVSSARGAAEPGGTHTVPLGVDWRLQHRHTASNGGPELWVPRVAQ